MDEKEAERYLPCYKMEIIQTGDDEGLYKFYCASSVNELMTNKYHPLWYRSFESFDEAYISAMQTILKYSGMDAEDESYMPFDEGNDYLSGIVVKHKITFTEKIEEFDKGLIQLSGRTLYSTGDIDVEVFVNNVEFYFKESLKYCPFYAVRSFSKAYVVMSEMLED